MNWLRRHGLDLNVIYTSGSSETLQPGDRRSVDLGIALKFVSAPLSKEQTAELIRIPGARR